MLYTDRTTSSLCIAPEKDGNSFCGGYTGEYPISDVVDNVWELFEHDLIHSDCDCEAELRRYLGFGSEEELDDFLRRKEARRLAAERQGGDD